MAVGMTGDDPGEHVGQDTPGIDVVELAGGNERGDDRPVLAAAVGAGEQAFFLPRVIGRMVRSTTLLSSSTRPSSRKRQRPSQRDSA